MVLRGLYEYLKLARMALSMSCFVALGVFLWPGALSAVTGFTLFGLSIAAVVGANLLFQVAAIVALTFVALHLVALTIEATAFAVSGLFNLFKKCCCCSDQDDSNDHGYSESEQPGMTSSSHNTMTQGMNTPSAPTSSTKSRSNQLPTQSVDTHDADNSFEGEVSQQSDSTLPGKRYPTLPPRRGGDDHRQDSQPGYPTP